MDRNLRILLIEDDPAECADISLCITNTEGAVLVGVTNNAEHGTELVADNLPDAVILDLELHRGGGNGIEFMRKLRELEIAPFPYILITTNNISKITHNMTRELGADFIFSKYQEDYSAENVIGFLMSMKNIIMSKKKPGTVFKMTPEQREQMDKRLFKRINAEMDLIGISHRLTGRRYIVEGILKTINEQEPNLTLWLARRHGKSAPSVERAIHTAIAYAWRNTAVEDLLKYYTAKVNTVRGIPTVTEFIFYYAGKIKNDM